MYVKKSHVNSAAWKGRYRMV